MRKQRKEKGKKKEKKKRQSFSTPPLITLRAGSTAVFLPTLPYNFRSLCLLMMSLEWSITIY
jgi:hypothetical protein